MVSGQTSCKARMLLVFIAVFALWATVAIAGVNEDLLEAAKRGDVPAVQRFIADGADVNTKDDNGLTALIAASFNGHKEVVQTLLDQGADVNAKMNDGATASMFAIKNGHKEVRELLVRAGAK